MPTPSTTAEIRAESRALSTQYSYLAYDQDNEDTHAADGIHCFV